MCGMCDALHKKTCGMCDALHRKTCGMCDALYRKACGMCDALHRKTCVVCVMPCIRRCVVCVMHCIRRRVVCVMHCIGRRVVCVIHCIGGYISRACKINAIVYALGSSFWHPRFHYIWVNTIGCNYLSRPHTHIKYLEHVFFTAPQGGIYKYCEVLRTVLNLSADQVLHCLSLRPRGGRGLDVIQARELWEKREDFWLDKNDLI